jgi:hypothetical protein
MYKTRGTAMGGGGGGGVVVGGPQAARENYGKIDIFKRKVWLSAINRF